MKMKKLAIVACAGALVAALALVGCSSGESSTKTSTDKSGSTASGYALVNPGKLTVAASLDFPPFESLDGDKPVGFAVELMKMLADEMGLECNYLTTVKFDTIVPMISAGGKADVGVSSFTINADRAKEIDFTEAYMDSNQSLVVMGNSAYADVAQLEGKKIGAQSGTTGYDWAVENIKGANVIPYDEVTAIFAALQAGQIDAISIDLPVSQSYIKNAYPDAKIIKETPTGEQYGIVVSKDNPELTKSLNQALAAVKSNGKYEALYSTWFGATA
ncbi:MAG: ABC transporter substrate-binding protein [Raoultibacter sp.]